ncbi:MAG: hypothetical protein DRI95_15255 [Bacteroidetes bacterium]|nr:MAG: hypothetical protein DRI95_15255 [Bacteroidota bacterium]
MRIENIRHIVISAFFIVIIVFVFINQSFKIITGNMNANENRTMAKKPEIDINKLDYFPNEYDEYYNDNFLLRADYISFMLFLSQKIFHKSDVKGNYIIGEDNWIFPMRRNLEWYAGEKNFNKKQLEKYKIEFEKRQEYFNSVGAKMYLLVIPSKYNIYTEYLPSVLRTKRRTWTDDFIQNFKNTSVKIVDGRQSLKKRKKDDIVYLKYDTHWNMLGAFYTLSDLIDTIRNDFPQLPNYELKDYNIDTLKRKNGNLINIITHSDSLYELDFDITHKGSDIQKCKGYEHIKMDYFRYSQNAYCMRFCNNSAKNNLKVVLFRDSFMSKTYNFFTSNFKEVLYIWDNWQYMYNKDIINIEKPDIVLYLFFEGYLDRMLVEPSFVDAEFTLEELD